MVLDFHQCLCDLVVNYRCSCCSAGTGDSRNSIISRSRSCATRWVLVASDQALGGMHLFHQVFAKHWLHAERLDLIHVSFNLRLPLLRILGRECGDAGVRFTSA